MTECSRAFIRYRGSEDAFDIKDSWLGDPLVGCEYRIKNNDTEGELLLKGKNLFTSYLQSKFTDEKFHNGWLKTGDICRVENGLVFLTGRIDNQINVGGEKLQLEHLESIIETLISVKRCTCFGVHDNVLGSKIATLIEIDEADVPINKSDIKSQIYGLLKDYPAFFHPTAITLVESLPMTHNGKKLRDTSILFKYQDE